MYSSIYNFVYNNCGMEITSDQVCQDVLSLLMRFKQELSKVAESYQLTPVQLGALFMIDEHGELAMGEVAHVLHCDPSNVTGIIDRLVSHKFVLRQESQKDRRAKTITLTPHGKEIIDHVHGMLPDRLGCPELTSSERLAIHSAVQKLAL